MQRDWKNAFKILTGKYTGERPLGRHRRRWKDNIRMDLKEIGINTRTCGLGSGYELLENPCECDIEPPGSTTYEVNQVHFKASIKYFISSTVFFMYNNNLLI